jgi:NTE family protein
LPRYGLLDHRALEDELERKNPGDIEDLWRPFFAVAADLSTDTLRVIREGLLWQAIRASCSMPGVLPPFIDDAGHMLVDGGVRDNLPVGAMNSLKSGPNLVIDLQPAKNQLFNFSYRSIPGRGELIVHMLNPWPWKKPLPPCPGPATVIARSLSRKIIGNAEKKNPLELVLHPPVFPGSSFMDWSRYADVMDASYEWGRKTVETLRENGDPALAAMLNLSRSQLEYKSTTGKCFV